MRRTKTALLNKYHDKETQADIDLLVYYLSSSLDSFVYGDFGRSYMDAFKIAFDSKGKSFKRLCVLPENKVR